MKSSEKPNGTERYPQYAFLLALLLTSVAYQAYKAGLEPRDGFISSTQTENCVASGRNKTLCYLRTLVISSLIVLLSLSAIAVPGAEGASDNTATRLRRPLRGVQRHVKFTLLDSNNHWNRILTALVHFIGLELSDGFISTQTENCVASGRNETLCYRRTLGISSLIVLFSIAAIAATEVEGASDNHGNTPPPPPWWRTMAHEHFSFTQQESLEQDLHGFRSFYRDVDHCMENAINTLMRIEGEAKVLRQSLQELRRNGKQNQSADHHPRLEAAGPSGEAQAIYEEVTGPTHKLNLCFHGSLKSRIYTNSPLLGQINGGIEIAIYRDGEIITSGHLSSLRVEIVALESDHSCKGDWTEEDFDGQIRKRRAGPGSVLEGECFMDLVNGRASLGNIRFKEGSSGSRSREFVLAARVCRSQNIGGLRVQEAFMHPPITVLVERSKENEKSGVPKLNDEVHRLKGIGKDGIYAKRLGEQKISTVQDFLKALNKDEDKLRKDLKMASKKSWETLVGNARHCDLRDKHELKAYTVDGTNVKLFFNCVHDLVGAEFHGIFVVKDKFDEVQKVSVDTQLTNAYNVLEQTKFDYVMKDNHPVKISTNTNSAAGGPSIPMSGASLQNTSDHQAAFQGAEINLRPSGIGRSPGLPLGDANRNAAGHSPSEPSPPDHRNQGVIQDRVPEGDAVRPATASADVDMDEFWKSVKEDMPRPAQADGSEPTGDFWSGCPFDASDLLDQPTNGTSS